MKSRQCLSAFVALAALAAFPGSWVLGAESAPRRDPQGRPAIDGLDGSGQSRAWLKSLHPTPACPLPRARPKDLLIAFGTYEGDSVASTAVGGPDQETNLADVVIEPGSRPLYLILSSYESMVWRLSGATDRVRHVVVSSYQTSERAARAQRLKRRLAYEERTPAEAWKIVSASGVTGVPAEKVVIAPENCPRYFYRAGEAAAALGRAREAIGRDPDAVFGAYSTHRVRLPSGAVATAERGAARLPPGFDRAMWRDALGFWPGGLVYVDPGDVVAAASVELYRVLPSQMGLAQLIGAGAVEPLGSGRFRILRPIPHLPPGMGGAHSVTFILAEGVPLPPGNRGHSCIVEERDSVRLRPDQRC